MQEKIWLATKQDVSQTGTISATSTVKTEFTNYYHPTVWLDTDNDLTNGNTGFPVYKHLLDNEGKEIGFFGGNTYTILVRAGAQSPAGTPLPNLAQPTDTDGSLGLPSTRGDRELTRSFDAVRFEQPGTYYYLFREMGPDSSTAVPGVSYDPTRYRVTVVVGVDATGNNLTCRITRLQKLVGSSEGDGPDAGWTEVVSAAENASLDLTDAANPAKRIVFHNTYSETEVSRAFKPKKELKGRKEPLQAGEFTFTLTAVGSHNMTQAEAELYHDVGVTNDDRLDQLKRFNNWTADGAQPMPGGKYAQTVKEIEVKNDSSGAIVLGSITYTADNMGEQDYGKVYKYTLTEKVPAGAVDGKFKGITYDTETRTLYVYVHLHYKAAAGSALAPLGASDTLVYADVLGDRNATFTNTYEATPVIVDLGGGSDPGNNVIGASVVKKITGRSFQAGDTFTFTLTPASADTPMPKDATGNRLATVTSTISPTSGTSAPISFGKIEFTKAGTYTYKLKEAGGALSRLTYDTAEKTLTITVTDVDGALTATLSPAAVAWTNAYQKPAEPEKPEPSRPEKPNSDSDKSDTGGGDRGSDRESSDSKPKPKLDTSDHFAYILGKSDGLVHPNDSITRAEVATIFYRLLTEDSRRALWTKENPYPDVKLGDWCNVAISVMSKAGVIKGRSNGNFDPYRH